MIGSKRKDLVGQILGPKQEDAGSVDQEGPGALHAISEELIDAVHSKDAPAVASALKAAFEELDSDIDEG